jgi:hypothetical protein
MLRENQRCRTWASNQKQLLAMQTRRISNPYNHLLVSSPDYGFPPGEATFAHLWRDQKGIATLYVLDHPVVLSYSVAVK